MQQPLKNYYCLLFLFLLIGCKENSKLNFLFQKRVQKTIIFPENKFLAAEQIPFTSLTYPEFVDLSNGYLFISNSKIDSMVHIYSTPDLKYVNSMGIRGGAEFDFQSFPMFCKSFNEYVYIWGYTPLRIKKFSVLENGKLDFVNNFNLTYRESFNQMHILHDSLLIYNAIPSKFSIKKYDLIHSKYLGEIKIEEDEHKESFFYKNRGFIAANDSLILYAYVYQKKIDVYNLNSMEKKFTLTDNYKEQSIRIGDFESNTMHYLRIFAGYNYFYALYKGGRDAISFLEVFDYAGNPIIKYTFDITPYMFTVDEQNGYIYGFNPDFEDFLFRYKL